MAQKISVFNANNTWRTSLFHSDKLNEIKTALTKKLIEIKFEGYLLPFGSEYFVLLSPL
jgi:hypothetical protein